MKKRTDFKYLTDDWAEEGLALSYLLRKATGALMCRTYGKVK